MANIKYTNWEYANDPKRHVPYSTQIPLFPYTCSQCNSTSASQIWKEFTVVSNLHNKVKIIDCRRISLCCVENSCWLSSEMMPRYCHTWKNNIHDQMLILAKNFVSPCNHQLYFDDGTVATVTGSHMARLSKTTFLWNRFVGLSLSPCNKSSLAVYIIRHEHLRAMYKYIPNMKF